MVRKKIDNRIRTLVENGIATGHRSMFVVVGEKARPQVVLLHHILTKAVVAARPSVLWCYKKDLGFTSNRKKQRKIEAKKRRGNMEVNEDDPFETFISTTEIRYCYYKETKEILGNTYGMLVLQDFEAITPNILARTIETVRGGGAIVLLLSSVDSLRQLYTMSMDIHSRYRTEAHQDVVGRFCERFILSLSDCASCLVINDQLEVLPLSSHIVGLEPVPPTAVSEMSADEAELARLKTDMANVRPIGAMIKQCKTLDQAKVVLRLLDLATERAATAIASITAARGRGKSAALGLAVAGAISLNYTHVFVTSPSPENLKAFFEFLRHGIEALGYKEHTDFEFVHSQKPQKHKSIVAVNIFRSHRQSIRYIEPHEASLLAQAELLVIDEAAAIPLTLVRRLIAGTHMTFLSSTINGYEGTGRSLSLKLLQQLRAQSASEAAASGADVTPGVRSRVLHELTLEESVRYKSDDACELWLNKLLCLDAPNLAYKVAGSPPPDLCELYYVNRDTLFSYHRASESFLSRVMSIFVAAHYRNSPDDLQMLSDAPAHHLFVLMSPVKKAKATLPEVIAVIQVCMEGQLSKASVAHSADRGRRAAGDLIPWTISHHYLDSDFPQLCGARIVRIAVHPQLHSSGYGTQALKLLHDYYEGKFASASAAAMTLTAEALRNAFDEDDKVASDEELESLRRTTKLPPLLTRLSERAPEHLDYIGASFGVNLPLLKFWKSAGFLLAYMRPTTSDITGEHTCIMLKSVKNSKSEYEKVDDWLDTYYYDFRKRFISLLNFEYREFAPRLVSSLMQKDLKKAQAAKAATPLSRDALALFLSNTDLRRLATYAANMADHNLIIDLVPTLAQLYFSARLDEVALDPIQSAVIQSMGLQRKTAEATAAELSIMTSQIMASFNKAMRKFSTRLDAICVNAVDAESAATGVEAAAESAAAALKPSAVTLEAELKRGERDIRARQERDRDALYAELGLADVVAGGRASDNGQLSQFAIKATDDEWRSALDSIKLSNAKGGGGIVSVKAPKRVAPQPRAGDELDALTQRSPKQKEKRRKRQ